MIPKTYSHKFKKLILIEQLEIRINIKTHITSYTPNKLYSNNVTLSFMIDSLIIVDKMNLYHSSNSR